MGALGIVAATLGGTLLLLHLWTGVALLGVGGILVMVTPVVTAFSEIKAETLTTKLHEREQALSTLVELTHQLCEIDEKHDVRVTLLEIDRSIDPPQLKQLARCSPSGRQSASKSSMTIQQGVAGLALRKMDGKAASLTVNVEAGTFIEQMVNFGFTREQAQQFKERGSYLCTPIVNSVGEGIAVLSLDAKDENVFKPEHTVITERVTPFFTRFLTAQERAGGEDAEQG
jgi:hypothetical protein